ncbi:MAG: hypothetical protein H8D45_25820 [Bacteroidetes bacterium]|nr:hypothetical protein [Bacteroidota bacterium]
MKILINDIESNKDSYVRTFTSFGYEVNELIFCNSFEQVKVFFEQYLEKLQTHIDLIITNDSSLSEKDVLRCNELCFLKNSLVHSFSNHNFRICSIPIILHSHNESKSEELSFPYSSVVKLNDKGNNNYFIQECERLIRKWRKEIIIDLDTLELGIESLKNFHLSKFYRGDYSRKIVKDSESYFTIKTKILSLEFIKCPQELRYDWLVLKDHQIEQAIEEFSIVYRHHVKYDKKDNERTILHKFFNDNKIILLRDIFSELNYEQNLHEVDSKESEECDFILKTEYPEHLKTVFFEVKREDVKFFVNKKRKRPSLNKKFIENLDQIWGYKKFSKNPKNATELFNKIGYATDNYEYVLLAGRLEEKEEMEELFQQKLTDHYSEIIVQTFDELARVYGL